MSLRIQNSVGRPLRGWAAAATLILTVAAVPGMAYGQDTVPDLVGVTTFTLSGQVRDASSNRPVVAAVIKVPDLREYTFTRSDGSFEIQNFPVGTWTILVEQLGYHPVEGEFTVADGNGLIISMNPDPLSLAGFQIRSRSERLTYERRRRIPYAVRSIGSVCAL